jgi:hypothetical protein|tara:strand:- start:330 stop:560 length:231 start_codon:yes stop_codon:yes gene_type:complete
MVSNKKRFYNRVRRTCLKHDIDIELDGAPRNWRSVQLLKDGQLLLGDYAEGRRPLDIDWQRMHEELTKYGFVGGAK